MFAAAALHAAQTAAQTAAAHHPPALAVGTVALLCIVFAYLADRHGLGADSWGGRFAFLLAVVFYRIALDGSPAGRWLDRQEIKMSHGVGNLVGRASPVIGQAIYHDGRWVAAAALVVVVGGMLLPGFLSSKVGPIANKRIGTFMTWIGALIIATASLTIPGNFGDVVVAMIDGAVSGAGDFWSWLFA